MKRISIFHAVLINKTCITGAGPTQGRSIRGPFIVIGLQCGAQYRESGSLVLTIWWRRSSGYREFWAVCRHDPRVFCASPWGIKCRACLVPAGWGHGPHSSKVNGCFEGDVPRPTDLPERRYFVARALTRLTPCDYFLWGYLKVEVFKHRLRTL